MRDATHLDLRPVTAEEFPAYARAIELAFGEEPSDAAIDRWQSFWELERSLAAFDGDRIVATAGLYSFRMSLPFADPAACGGVTVVGVAHDWRRRGVLTRMMRRQLDDVRAAGEPFAALFASESPIYGRYGYGIAAPMTNWRIERPFAAFDDPVTPDLVGLVTPAVAVERFPRVLDRVRGQRGGVMHRTDAHWRAVLEHDDPGEREGASPRFLALVEDDRGYATYRVKPRWEHGAPEGTLRCSELVAADPEAYAALYQHLFGVDLVRTIEAWWQPPDHPLPYVVTNRARVAEMPVPDLWLRLVDVGAALSARGYTTDGRLVFEVRDGFCPWNEGRWELEAADREVRCERTDAAPDLRLDVAELAALSLGGVSATRLAWARRIEACTGGALERADRLFAVDLAPFNPFEF